MLKDKIYKLTNKEKILLLLKIYITYLLVTLIFYKNLIVAIILSFVSLYLIKFEIQELIKKRKNKLLLQFRDFLHSFSSALETGDNVINAINSAYLELKNIYNNKDYIIQELSYIIKMSKLGSSVNELFLEFGNDSGLEDIKNFASVFNVCLSSGANISEVIKNTSNIIVERLEIENEINSIFAGKVYEMKLLSLIPIILFFIISLCAAEYIEPLYKSISGYITITISLILILIANIVSQKIMKIE